MSGAVRLCVFERSAIAQGGIVKYRLDSALEMDSPICHAMPRSASEHALSRDELQQLLSREGPIGQQTIRSPIGRSAFPITKPAAARPFPATKVAAAAAAVAVRKAEMPAFGTVAC